MADRLFVDLTADGRVWADMWPGGHPPGGSGGESAGMVAPLDAGALEELRWYLEDYLRLPFGVYESRGPGVAAQLASWGEAVFAAVFGSGSARAAYERVRDSLAGLQVVFRAGSADLLGLPWELMRDPARNTPLALDVAGMDRSLPAAQLSTPFAVAGGGRLRVLMVISRPAGTLDVGFRMIARPLLQRLEAVRGTVDLVVLRPPTVATLAAALSEAAERGEPFQVVHFDGHGALAQHSPADTSAPGAQRDPVPEGVLVFEGPAGMGIPVPASRVAQVLAAARVPVVVLNACQSGAVGKQVEAAVATRLLQGGAASVVAMAYSVYAVAAAEFMSVFYERLFAGDTVSAAVTAGRQQLYRHDLRPSPKGDLPLADWLVPVHYVNQEVRFPGLVTARPADSPPLEEALDQLRGRGHGDDGGPLAPVGVFTGRDGLFYELETAARHQRVVLLQGPAGIGKTELAKAFGRWWQETDGVERPEWVFWHSFQPGLASFGLDGIINEIGLTVFGSGFSRLDEADRTAAVEKFLRDRRTLLIWDNFESIRSLPDPSEATPLLDDGGCRQLSDFLHRLATYGRSAVLITSRSDEAWLDDARATNATASLSPAGLCRIKVPGLQVQEAADYADDLLAPYPAATPRRASRAFGELMEWLDGHPLSMRLVLPHLATTDADALLDGLRGTTPLPGWGDDSQLDRSSSLPASLGYSFSHLAPATQRLLTAVCLLRGTADATVLAFFSVTEGVPERFHGIARNVWIQALDAADQVGLLARVRVGKYKAAYQLHPALPAYLAAFWRDEEPAEYERQRAAATRALVSAYADFGDLLDKAIDASRPGDALTIVGLQQRTMGHLLDYALSEKHWHEARAIARPMDDYWNARGLFHEAAAWTSRVRAAVEDADGHAPALDSPAGSLWLFFVFAQAHRQQISGQLDTAAWTYREVLALVEATPVSGNQQYRLALTYHQLGRVEMDRDQLEEATKWLMRSTDLMEHGGDRPGRALNYHELGKLSVKRDRLEEAADWFTKSLAVEEELGNRSGMARSYLELGEVAQRRGRLGEAGQWYAESLRIWQELSDRPLMARCYHRLGMLAQDLGRPEQATNWYARALTISEDLGDRPAIASTYHQLGMLAQDRGRLGEAADWYARSLAVEQELGDRDGMALTYSQLGLLAEEQGRPAEALEWTVRCVALFADVPHPGSGTGPGQLAELAHQFGVHVLEACWHRVTGTSLPGAVRDYVRSYP